jgi:hypothetical protein
VQFIADEIFGASLLLLLRLMLLKCDTPSAQLLDGPICGRIDALTTHPAETITSFTPTDVAAGFHDSTGATSRIWRGTPNVAATTQEIAGTLWRCDINRESN